MGQHRSASASKLLGLDGLRSSPPVVVGGEWRLAVQTTATAVDFRGRGARAELHDRRTVRVRDLPSGGCPVVLPGARGSGAVVSQPAGRHLGRRAAPIRPTAVLTQRARAQACRRVGKDAHAVAAVARDLGRWLGDRDAGGGDHGPPLVDDAARLEGWRPSAGRDELSSGNSYGADPMDDRSGRPWSAAGCWTWWPTAPGRRGRLASGPAARLAGPGRHGRAGP
jgi:hypothetical protein